VVRVPNRDALQKHLAGAGIGTGIHYPIPLHMQKAYADLGYRKGDFPVSEGAAADILSLPMFPGLGCEEQGHIARQVLAFVGAATNSETSASARASYLAAEGAS
jgi:dTDP-4-amino-4,6-dideoxygalactose transaminase